MRAITVALLAGLLVGCWADEKPAKVAGVRKAECRRRTGPIKIDGVIDEATWKDAQPISDFVVFWEKRKARTTIRISRRSSRAKPSRRAKSR